MEQEVKAVTITEEQLAEYQRLKEAEANREAELRAKAEREDFRRLCEEAVDDVFGAVKRANALLRDTKLVVVNSFRTLVEMKESIMGGKDQGQHTFRNREGNRRITLGRYKKVAYDVTANAGILLIEDTLADLADTEQSKKLVKIILDLLSRDGHGQLQAENVIQLDKYIDLVGDDRFARGVSIIKEAFLSEWTKIFIRAEEKNEEGKWVTIPLSMVEV